MESHASCVSRKDLSILWLMGYSNLTLKTVLTDYPGQTFLIPSHSMK